MLLPIVKQLNSKRIVLASSSPRRQELLQNIVSISTVLNLVVTENSEIKRALIFILYSLFFNLNQGLVVESCASTFEENLDLKDFSGFAEFVEETALQKVLEVSNRLNATAEAEGKPPVDIVIGADTMVTMDGKMYGKPKNSENAIETLTKYVIT